MKYSQKIIEKFPRCARDVHMRKFQRCKGEREKRTEKGDFSEHHKEIEIQGCVEISTEQTEEAFWNAFVSFLEERKWYFGGGMRTIFDGYDINADGSRGDHIMEEEDDRGH